MQSISLSMPSKTSAGNSSRSNGAHRFATRRRHGSRTVLIRRHLQGERVTGLPQDGLGHRDRQHVKQERRFYFFFSFILDFAPHRRYRWHTRQGVFALRLVSYLSSRWLFSESSIINLHTVVLACGYSDIVIKNTCPPMPPRFPLPCLSVYGRCGLQCRRVLATSVAVVVVVFVLTSVVL
jgi:hypothetical protein